MSGPVEAIDLAASPRPDRLAAVIWRDLHADPAGSVFALGISGVLAGLIAGLPLAMLGWFRPAIVLPLVLSAWIAMVGFTWRRGLGSLVDRGRPLWSVLAVVIVVGFGAFAAANSGQHIRTDRDPGVYVATALWLTDHGNLIYDTGLPDEVISASGGPEAWVTQGVYPRQDGTGYFQFTHALAVLLAMGGWLGEGMMLRMPAVIAALACLGVYVLARRLAGPAFALVALVAVVLHPVALHFAKDAYSEFLALAFLAAGLALWLKADDASRTHWLLTGALLGGITLARIDGWLTLACFLLGVAYFVALQPDGRPKAVAVPFFAGMAGVAALGMVDLSTRSPVYLSHLGSEVYPLITVVAAAVVVIAVAHRLGRRHRFEFLHRARGALAVGAGALIGGLALFGLFVRPLISAVRDTDHVGDITGLQAREGLEVDRFRSYAEDSMRWLTRYEGYVLVLFVLAAVVVATVVMIRAADRRTPVVVMFLGVSLYYLWVPSISPDHFWAMRRYLPVVIPVGFIVLAWAVAWALDPGRRRRTTSVVLALGLAVGGATMLSVGAPVATARTQVGLLDAARVVCADLPEGAAAIMNDNLGDTFAVAVRTVCDVPVLRADDAEAIAAVRAAGFVPMAVTEPRRCLGGGEDASYERWYSMPEVTISRAPAGPESALFAVSIKGLDESEITPTEIPPTAVAGFEVVVTSTGQARDSIIATLGTAETGLRLRLARDGSAEMVVDTTAGRLGVVVSFWSIADGRPRVLGGYVAGNTIYATCDGQVMAATELPGAVTYLGDELTLRPQPGADAPVDRYAGEVDFVQVRVAD